MPSIYDEKNKFHKEISAYLDEPFRSRDEFELKRARKTLTDTEIRTELDKLRPKII